MGKRSDPIPASYRIWLIASIVVLVGSLILLAIAVTAAFITFNQKATPLWVIVLGAFAGFGVALGFGGFFLLMVTAGYTAWRASRKVRLLPPEHDPKTTGTANR